MYVIFISKISILKALFHKGLLGVTLSKLYVVLVAISECLHLRPIFYSNYGKCPCCGYIPEITYAIFNPRALLE